MKLESKSKHSKSITHKELEKSIQITPSMENPNFLDFDDIDIKILAFTITNIIFILSTVILI